MRDEGERLAREQSNRLRADIHAIDAQHRKIFDLAASFSGTGDQLGMMMSLHILCDYVNVHFREEEALMLAEANPSLADHRAQHTWFREQLLRLLEEAKGMSLDQVAEEVRRLIDGWLYEHVLEFDSEDLPCGKPEAACVSPA
jgi:hemerythrin